MKIRSIIYALAGVLVLSAAVFAAKPPAKVIRAFEAKFSNASNVKWGRENSTEWEAGFTLNGVKMSANFKNDGSWVETETEISVADLPAVVASAIKSGHAGWTVTHAYRIESASKGTFYEAEIASGGKKKEIMLKEDGSAMK